MKRLHCCAGILAGLLFLAGCYAPVNEGAAGTALSRRLRAKPTGMPSLAHMGRNTVVISGDSVPVEPGVPFSIGESVEGRPLLAYRFGEGPVFIALIGGIHGSYEANTVMLANRFIDFLRGSPEVVPSNVSVFVIPAMNPDGLARTGPRGRVNANRVDLNRNWGCDWIEDAASYQGVPFTTGSSAFSEPETRAVREFLLHNDVRVAVFYHSRGSVVFYGECGQAGQSLELATSLSRATGYHVEDSAEYPTTRALPGSITGEAADYLDSQGVAAIDVELSSREKDSIGWEENHKGLLAILDHTVRVYVTPEEPNGVVSAPDVP